MVEKLAKKGMGIVDVAEAKKLVGYCGVYCSGCGMFRGRIIARVAADLEELVETHGYPDRVPESGGIDFDFAQFRKGLAYFTRESSGCYCQVPCQEGGGMPNCKIRECAQERGDVICFECSDYPCERLSGFCEDRPRLREEHWRFGELGMGEWIQAHVRSAARGYCRGTCKFYRVPNAQ